MKRTTFIATLAACFVGVLGALQVDRMVTARNKPDDIFAESKPFFGSLRQVKAEPLAQPAFDFREAAKRVMPSVVSVDRFDKVRGFFEQQASERETGQGSGVIVSQDGVIVTNNHVVEAQAMGRRGQAVSPRVQVRLFDGRKVEAKILGTDPRSDLAVLKIDAQNLQPIDLGSSSNLEVGEWVMAVGNPLGFDNTVSVGVVSSKKRNLPVGENGLVEGIQTDAAINPGNSGGALCNAQGQLIGINSAIASGTGQSVGIGFAIPIDRAKKIVNDIVKYGAPRYAGLGVSYVGNIAGQLDNPWVRQEVADYLKREDFPSHGLLLNQVGGPAASAGIKANDFLLEIDGQKVETTFDLNKVILTKNIGDKVKVKFWQAGQTKEVTIALTEIKPTI
ncbi:MAG: trypsin-like peptidase domain-containing protein [Armatimonadota bacterium]